MTPGGLVSSRAGVRWHRDMPPCAPAVTFFVADLDNRPGVPQALAGGRHVGYEAACNNGRERGMQMFRDGARPFHRWALALVIAAAGIVTAGAFVPAAAQTARKIMTTPSGLQITDIKVGTGATPKPGQICVMHYTGWLYEKGQKGKKFDSSVDRKEPFEFTIGKGQVIKGWDEGVATMKVGGQRTLIIPPELGYGARGAGGVIPPNATLMFDVELLDIL